MFDINLTIIWKAELIKCTDKIPTWVEVAGL